MPRYAGFIGPSYTAQSKIAADDELINLYVEKTESGTGKAPYVAYSAPGFRQWCDLGTTSPVRGQYTLNGASFAVAGGTLYDLPTSRGGSPTTRTTGLHNPDNSLVSIAGSGDGSFQLVLTAGSRLYGFDLRTNVLTEIPDIAASFVTFIDGTFYALDPSTSRLYASAPEDGTSWDVLDVAQRSDAADKWLALLVNHGELWLPGSKTGSVYYSSGSDDFPFSPNPAGKLGSGILAPQSACVVDGDPMWLAQNEAGGAMLVRAQGYGLQRVSTHAFEYALSTYSSVSDADAFTYQDGGHVFYVLNFPTANVTWVYDATTGLLHKRGLWNGLTHGVLPVRTHLYANGAHLVGDRSTGIVWEMSSAVSTDTDGTGLMRLRRAPHLCDELKNVVYDSLQLDMEVGLGLSTGQGSAPDMMLRWSDNGGQSFGNVHTVSAGVLGNYAARAIWRQLGMGRDRVFEWSCSEPIPIRLIDCYLMLRGGRS